VVSMGMGPTFATMVIAATTGVSDNEQGLASGVFTTTQQVGSGLVLAIAVAISSARTAALMQVGGNADKGALTAGLQYALSLRDLPTSFLRQGSLRWISSHQCQACVLLNAPHAATSLSPVCASLTLP
jgi:hypothetical protein